MKGLVFTEFLEMVEDKFSPELADEIIETSELPSHGIYTSVGTYDHTEMVQLVTRLSEQSGMQASELINQFGVHLFRRFAQIYPQLFGAADHRVFPFMENIDNTIHAEVHKLYPDAELPKFECEYPDSRTQRLTYRSARPFGDLAEGLIRGAIAYFGEAIEVSREDLPCEQGAHVRFTLVRQD